jgi:hypothetical protein
MCTSKPDIPEQKELPPPPAPPEETAEQPVIEEGALRAGEDDEAGGKRTGTRSLRIDLNIGGGGSNLNVPVA